MMKLRLAQPETLIDINGLSELSYITVTAGELRIGALTRHAQLLDSGEAARHFAVLHDAEQVIADPVVRNWGTVGGSLCQADPSEDLSAAFAALKATMVIRGPDGTRTVSAREFHTGPYETVVAPAELLTEIRMAIRPGGGSAYEKVGRRVGDWPVGAAAAAVWLTGETIAEAGVGRGDIDVAEFYDATSYMPLRSLESYGFVPDGQAWRYVTEAGTGPGSPLPVNTHGGHLSEAYLHGMNGILEAVRQLRGTAVNQVPDADVALVGAPAGSATILAR